MTRPVIAVTGCTGAVGGAVARLLADAGASQRLLARSPDRAPALPGAEVRASEYADAASSAAALEGVDVLFMVSAHETADRVDQHRAFIDAAARAGVRHVVYTSFHAAGPDAVFTLARDHGATEEHLRGSGLDWTFLRDSFYLDFAPHLVGDDGVIRGPAGQGRYAPVARADVARCAATVLQDPAAHRGSTYELTGRESLTMAEVAATIAAATGSAVRFHDETVAEAHASRAPYGAPDWQVDAWVSTYTSIASGEQDVLSSDVLDLTGRVPVTLAEHLASEG
ncbi:SDR family oxidoreductase [Aeromicrobium sp. Sec7.5]|uniref:SDR family oxidoreductase n=1 Tax=Aeromicrobium sp. Sec7.5 TaxID=3121276 RepID=UPI002FE47318